MAGSFRKKNIGKEELVEWATETGSYLAEHLLGSMNYKTVYGEAR